uniref:Uncharacterized protein n=1 Tax=Anguilla anguilla TaxID=7936 RepID=A0A0E9WPS3_ANGAN
MLEKNFTFEIIFSSLRLPLLHNRILGTFSFINEADIFCCKKRLIMYVTK